VLLPLDVINAKRYYVHMIQSYAEKDTEKLANLERVPRFEAFERIALRKLTQLNVAETLDDLRIPPGNRPELLKGKRDGQYPIRINDQYRICFKWGERGPCEVEICDYH